MTGFRGLASWYALYRTSTKGWHSVNVDLIECDSNNCKYLLTGCKSVALRDGLLKRMFNSSLQYDCMFCKESHKSCHFFFLNQVCNCRNTKHASFAAFSTTTAAFTSSAVNKYLRQSSLPTLYIRQTLNPVWDAFTAIWSLLSHSLQHTYTFHFQHRTYPACKVASIFHNASCNIERYGPWFHLCGAVVALLSVPEWNSCGPMSLICQSQADGVSMCCRELQWSISKLQRYR